MLIVSPEAASAIAVVSDEAPLYSTPVRTFFVWHGGGPATAAGAIRTTEIATRPSANAAGPCTVRLPRICTMALLPSFSEDRRCPPCTSMSEAARVSRQPDNLRCRSATWLAYSVRPYVVATGIARSRRLTYDITRPRATCARRRRQGRTARGSDLRPRPTPRDGTRSPRASHAPPPPTSPRSRRSPGGPATRPNSSRAVLPRSGSDSALLARRTRSSSKPRLTKNACLCLRVHSTRLGWMLELAMAAP